MPRVPVAPVTQGPIRVASLAQPAGRIATSRSVAGVFDEASQLGFQFVKMDQDARRKHYVSLGKAQLTRDLGALQLAAANDPNIDGSSDKFDAGAEALLQGVEEKFDKDTAALITNDGVQIAAATGVSVRSTERKRFNELAAVEMGKLHTNYATASAIAVNPMVADQYKQAHNIAITGSVYLSPAQQAEFISGFDETVSTTKALNLLSSDPDSLIMNVTDPQQFPGLSPERAIRIQGNALSASARNRRDEERSQIRRSKQFQDNTLRDMEARFVAGESPAVLQADLLANKNDYSASGFKVVQTMLKESATTVNDQTTVVEIDNAIRDGDRNTIDTINSAYSNMRITYDARNRFISRFETRNENPNSAIQDGYASIHSGLAPGPYDRWGPNVKIEAVLRANNAKAKFDDWLRLNPKADRGQVTAAVEDIMLSFRSSVRVTSTLPIPAGLPPETNIKSITPEQIQASEDFIDAEWDAGRMDETTAMQLHDNNDKLMPWAVQHQAQLLKEASEKGK